jgi:hypothetical protein
VAHARRDLSLAEEAFEVLSVGRSGDRLEGDLAPEPLVARAVDAALAALA